MKALVIGMGIGELYKKVLTELNYKVITVDMVRAADYQNVDDAIEAHKRFDFAFICTPNHTHEPLAYKVANYCHAVLIEKPGLESASRWSALVNTFPLTKFMMVKNNQYRDEIEFFRTLKERSDAININWVNFNRVPNPGSWFTNSELSYGGVSRDLMPHLLSLVSALNLSNYQDSIVINRVQKQRWKLADLTDTDYGSINDDGIYNVDDYCLIELTCNKRIVKLTADWRSLEKDDVGISFQMPDRIRDFKLGLCPESAYSKMIQTAMNNIDYSTWWKEQLEQDLWIHRIIQP